jgi:ATP-dependent RNA helicase DeaD
MQVSEAIHKYGRGLGVRVLPVYGGQPIRSQLRALQRGVDVVVATPGRAVDHLKRGTMKLGSLDVVVLDEADEMLDMGFAEDLEAILTEAPEDRQTVLFSATMPPRIASIADRHLRDAVRIELGREETAPGEGPLIRQVAYIVPRANKPAALGYRAEALHGGMTQEQRDRVMKKLRGGASDLLVATDVAARGLDVDQLTHVVNYDVPSAPAAYTHRIGRVGRAGREGVAITLAQPREHRLVKQIERATGQRIAIEKIPTVADLRTRRLELTRAGLEESLLEDELDSFRTVVETLAEQYDVMDVAAAAVKLAHELSGAPVDEEEIPEVQAPRERNGTGGGPKGRPSARGDRPPKRTSHGMTRLFVGAGRAAGIRPQDLVGAIANESSVAGREIGAIEIADRFSLVEVPEAAAEEVITALKASSIKGRRTNVRRERY